MQVLATAGHVDHGKSTLLRALTGMEPDRWAEERRRGMTIDLGYAWTTLPSGQVMAFVDVPGHERFAANMLAGVGPAPAVLMVVAADGGWAAQSSEHLAALQALGVRRGVLAVTRSDLADPAPALAEASERLAEAGLDAEGVAVSGHTGAGLADLRGALDRLAGRMPAPDTGTRTRLWVDRAFTIRGAGTVLTGTLGQGRLRVGETVSLSGRPVVVRGLHELGVDVRAARAVARVAVNVRGVERREAARGDVVLSATGWRSTTELDVRLVTVAGTPAALPRDVVAHLGSAAVAATVRPLGPQVVRLRLNRPLFLQVGDRGVLRDPGRGAVAAGLVVLDPLPPTLRRRGAAAERARVLTEPTGPSQLGAEVERRQAVRREVLAAIGVDGPTPPGVVEQDGWLVAAATWLRWGEQLAAAVRAGQQRDLLADGLSRAAAATAAGLSDPALLSAVIASRPDLREQDGRVRTTGHDRRLDPALERALRPLLDRLEHAWSAAPESDELTALGLGGRELGAAAAAGVILRLPGDVVLAADAASRAAGLLAALPAPFTLSQARIALQTTRRVAVPLLEHLDRLGITVRLEDSTRRLRRGD
jgi:selenocysteine-specific elongation factor